MEAKNIMLRFAVLLNHFRRDNNLTVYEIADAIEIHPVKISGWVDMAGKKEKTECANYDPSAQLDFDFNDGHDDDDVLTKDVRYLSRDERRKLSRMLSDFCDKSNEKQFIIAHARGVEASMLSKWKNGTYIPSKPSCVMIQEILRGERKIK